ncbi:MAG: metallophosphoesterase [Promicromonosporaceae bacterium]|nr:metallophosphoesterase [Promicromonosporaceae bacterium]
MVRRLAISAAALAAAGLLYAHLETKWFEIKHVSVPLLEPGERDVRILQLADLHYLPSQGIKSRWLASLAALEPDLIVNTGDNVASAASVPALLDIFSTSGLFEFPGVFVGGSNDYYAPILKNPARYLFRNRQIPWDLPPLPWQELFRGFEAGGWVNLNNARTRITLKDGRVISLVGTDDAHHDMEVLPVPPEPNQQNAPSHGSTDAWGDEQIASQAPLIKLGVTHAPYSHVLEAFQDDGVAAVIAAHTHGGQLRLPGFGALVTNCDLDRHRAEGLHGWPGARPNSPGGEDSMWLYVSAGAGTSPYAPFRFDCRPSATVLTLTAKPS